MSFNLSRARRALLVASATALALFLPGSAHAANQTQASQAPTEQVTIKAATSNGSGCRGGTAEVSVLPGNAGFNVTYHSEYLAHAGVGADPIDFRKNCLVSLSIDRPDGYTFAIVAARHSGFANLPEGASGLQRWSHYFQGNPSTRIVDNRFTSPYRDEWQITDYLPPDQLVWAPCDYERNLNVGTELRVSAGEPGTASLMLPNWSDDVADAEYRFAWRHC
jgi:Domain of unknown function (DUF4360)